MIKFPKRSISAVLILATLIAAVYYFNKHRNLLTELRHLSPAIGLSVFALYVVLFVVLVLIFRATLDIANSKVSHKENSLLNAYSLFMNFFIPGQTGPAFRAYYLNKKYKLKVLDYSLATIIYYLFYGLLSIVLVLAGSKAWWLTMLVAIAMVIVAVIGFKLYLAKFKQQRLNLAFKPLVFLLLTTLLQSVVQIIIYFVELHSINHAIKLHQVVTYCGAANLALFVALTPGAIGIRESFLVLTERLHHISSANIVLANVIDRSVYIAFLLILGLIIFAIKARDKLAVDKTDS